MSLDSKKCNTSNISNISMNEETATNKLINSVLLRQKTGSIKRMKTEKNSYIHRLETLKGHKFINITSKRRLIKNRGQIRTAASIFSVVNLLNCRQGVNESSSSSLLSSNNITHKVVISLKREETSEFIELRRPTMLVSLALMIIILANSVLVTESVDCFKCSSRNGSNPACEDPFHNLNTTRINQPVLPDPPPNVIYHTPCYAGKKGRQGLFPASACIKLTGTFDNTGETLVVRHCALDSGTLTQDTELARMSHCGKFQFEGDLLRGCVLACPEDACNSTPPRARFGPTISSMVFFMAAVSFTFYDTQSRFILLRYSP